MYSVKPLLRITALTITALLFTPVIINADSTEHSNAKKGLAIAIEADKRDMGFTDSTANMIMELRNKHGDISKRTLRIKTLEIIGDGDKSLSIFDQPADVKGTAFLTHSHALKPDSQWMYLPALKRVKRINSKNKSGPFMGSEFAFEDLASQEIEKYTYQFIRYDTINDVDFYVIERYPAYEHSGYTRQIVWLNKERYTAEKIEFYDRKNAPLKTLTNTDFHQYLNQFWRPHTMLMENHQTGKSTLLKWENFQFKTGLTAKDFTRNSLKRAR